MTNPKISIVMPTFNRAASFLKDAISSILSQSFSDFEFILIDDASTDNTYDLVCAFNDSRIKYFKAEKNLGEYWSTNYGVNLAKGEYLTWTHSDDLLTEDSLKKRLMVLENDKSLDFVHGDIEKIDANSEIIEKKVASDLPKEEILSQYLLMPEERKVKYLIHHTTIMMKWNFFYDAGPFDCSLPYAGDIDWLIRAIKAGKFQCIHEVLYKYRSHPGTRRVQDIKMGINENKVNQMIIRRYL